MSFKRKNTKPTKVSDVLMHCDVSEGLPWQPDHSWETSSNQTNFSQEDQYSSFLLTNANSLSNCALEAAAKDACSVPPWQVSISLSNDPLDLPTMVTATSSSSLKWSTVSCSAADSNGHDSSSSSLSASSIPTHTTWNMPTVLNATMGGHRKVITDSDIATIERLLSLGKSARNIAETIGCSIRTAQSYKKKYEENGSISRKKRGTKKKDKYRLQASISDLLATDSSLTLKGIRDNLPEDLKASTSNISRTLKLMKYSRKRLKPVVEERNSEPTLNDRATFCTNLLSIPEESMIYLDETGFNLHISQHYGYSLVDEVAYKTGPTNPGRNLTLVLAIAKTCIVSFEVYDGAFNSARMVDWINSTFPQFLQNRPFNIIMDNAKFHHSEILCEAIRTLNCSQRFLPAYSPQLNPIEEVFAMIKAKVRAHRPLAQNHEQLKSIVEAVLEELTSYDFSAVFGHMQEWAVKGRQKIAFI